MKNKKDTISEIFSRHGNEAIYITNTGFLSRDIFEMYPDNRNIFYMQGSMGLSPSIGLGLSMGTSRDVVVFVGDASLLMHLGSTHTIRDHAPPNLYVYVIDNGVHESVGRYQSSALEKKYPGVSEIFKVTCGDKKPRVAINFQENCKLIKDFLNE